MQLKGCSVYVGSWQGVQSIMVQKVWQVGPAPDGGGVRLLVHISVNQEEKGMLMLKWLSPFPF